MDECAEQKKKRKQRQVPWWNETLTELRKAVKQKERYYKYKCREPKTKAEYLECKNLFRYKFRQACREYWRKKICHMYLDEVKLYELIRKQNSTPPSRFTPTLQYKGITAETYEEKIEMVQTCFFPKSTPGNEAQLWKMPKRSKQEQAENPIVTEAEILQCIKSMKFDGSPGYDRIPLIVFSECWSTLKRLVVHIVQACFSFGYHPDCLKIGKTIALQEDCPITKRSSTNHNATNIKQDNRENSDNAHFLLA